MSSLVTRHSSLATRDSSLISGHPLLLRQDHQHLLDCGRSRFLHDEVGAPPSPTIALSRDASEPEHQVSRDRLGFFTRQVDPEILLELIEAEAAIEEIAPIARGRKAGPLLLVELVLNRPEQGFDGILDRDDPGG